MRRRSDPLLVLGMWLSLSGVAAALDASGLALETGSPDAFCPDLRQTREAVERRLGSLEVEGRRGWRARYTIGHAPEGSPRDFVRLELFTPQGDREFARDLPLRGESCSTMAEVIALVLDRHFRSLHIEEHQTKVAHAPLTDPSRDANTPLGSVAKPSKSLEAQSATPSRPRDSREVSTSRLGETSVSIPPRPALLLTGEFAETTQGTRQAFGLRAVGGIGNSLHIGAVVLFDVGNEMERLPRGGSVSASSSQLRAFLGWGRSFGPVLAYVGPGIGISLERGEARDLPKTNELSRAAWAASAETGLAVFVEERFLVQATFALAFELRPFSGKFYVEEREVLKRPTIQPWVGLGAGYAFHP